MTLNNIPVLIYHHINPHAGDTVTVTPEIFTSQMRFLTDEGYQTLSIDELLEFINGNKIITQKAVVITFDDGWLDNFNYAVPILANHKFKAAFFIISARVDAASAKTSGPVVAVPNHEASKIMIESGQANCVVLDWQTIKSLESSGFYNFYSHTVNHFRCADLSDDELKVELAHSKARIEAELCRSCDYLCWPYGSFSPKAVKMAIDVGYKGFFTTVEGYCESGSDPFMIKRIEVMNSIEWFKNRL